MTAMGVIAANRRRNIPSSGTGTVLDSFASGEQGFLFDPSDSATLVKSGGGGASVGDAISRIADTSPNGNHAGQATLAKCPLLIADGALRALRFDGVNDVMGFAASLALMGNFTLVMASVARHGSGGFYPPFCMSTSGSEALFYDNDGDGGAAGGFRQYVGGASYRFGSADQSDVKRVLTWRVTNGTQAFRANGAAVGSPSSTAFMPSGSPQGNLGATLKYSQFGKFDLYFAMLIGRALTPAELSQAEAMAGTRIGVAV